MFTAALALALAADPAADVLRANCHRCHGQAGSREGGLGAILDAATLRDRGLVVPGDADKSKLFQRVRKGAMPPPDEHPRPTPADIASLKTWIDAGAAPLTTAEASAEPPSNAEPHSLILRDLERLERRSRRFQRYFSRVPLARAGTPDAAL